MPHLIVEYSANVESLIELPALLDALHAGAIETGIFPVGGLRVRAHKMEHYRIADCHPDNGYLHVTAWIGHGRPLDVRKRAGDHLFRVLKSHVETLFESTPFALSFYMHECHPDLSWKKNNLHEYVRERHQTDE